MKRIDIVHLLVRNFHVQLDVIDLCSSCAHQRCSTAAAAHDQQELDHELEDAPSDAVEAVHLQLLLSASKHSERRYHDEQLGETPRHREKWVMTVN